MRMPKFANVFLLIWNGMTWLDRHWIGDLLGAMCLFALLFIGLFAADIFGGQ